MISEGTTSRPWAWRCGRPKEEVGGQGDDQQAMVLEVREYRRRKWEVRGRPQQAMGSDVGETEGGSGRSGDDQQAMGSEVGETEGGGSGRSGGGRGHTGSHQGEGTGGRGWVRSMPSPKTHLAFVVPGSVAKTWSRSFGAADRRTGDDIGSNWGAADG